MEFLRFAFFDMPDCVGVFVAEAHEMGEASFFIVVLGQRAADCGKDFYNLFQAESRCGMVLRTFLTALHEGRFYGKCAENFQAEGIAEFCLFHEAQPEAGLQSSADNEERGLVVTLLVEYGSGVEQISYDGGVGFGGFRRLGQLLQRCAYGDHLWEVACSGELPGGLVVLALPLVEAEGEG